MALDAGELVDAVPGLLRYARTLVRDEHRAEDLVQDTMVRAIERGDTFRGDATVGTWLRRILHNLAVDDARRRREVASGDLLGGADDAGAAVEAKWADDAYTVDTATVVERAETRAELEDALARLPVIYRSAVVLHDAEGLTSEEVADIHRIGLPAAKQRLRRGRMMLVSSLAAGAERREALKGVPMRCWDARAQVSDYLDGELAAPQRRLLEQHLTACPTCPPLYAGLVGAHTAMGALQDPDTVVPPSLADRIAVMLNP
jgi:RNA polymerase sigma-70 factor (ECF subfamily)